MAGKTVPGMAKASKPTTPATSRRPSAASVAKEASTSTSRPATPQKTPAPPPARPAAPGRDMTALLTLPLRIRLGATSSQPERTLSGSLWSFDVVSMWGVLVAPSLITTSAGPSSPQPSSTTTKKWTYHGFPSAAVTSVIVVSTTPAEQPSLPATARSASDGQARVQRAIAEDNKMRAGTSARAVSPAAQAIHDALVKASLSVRWFDSDIVVLDDVVISEPYDRNSIMGPKGSADKVDKVIKVLDAEWKKRRERSGTA